MTPFALFLLTCLAACGQAFTFHGDMPWLRGMDTPVATGGGGSMPNPVLWWKLNDASGSGAADASGNGYAGTWTGTPIWGTGPNANGDAVFNGSSYISSAATVSQISGAVNASLSCWLNINNGSTAAGFSGAMGTRFYVLNFGGTLYFVAENGSANAPSMSSPANGWHFVVITFDGSQASANRVVGYIDGSPVTLSGTGSNPTSLSTSLGDLFLGYDSGNNIFSVNGSEADDCRVYAVTLTQGQVTTLYTAGAQ